MNPPSKRGGAVLALLVIPLAVAAALALPPLERTSFRDLHSKDPVRAVLETVLRSRF